MAEHECVNCGSPATETYELLVRGGDHDDVPFCDPCHEAIEEELGELR